MDYRTPVVFDRGKPSERVVVFNEDAPSRSQALAAELVTTLLVYIGGVGWLLAWAFSALACVMLSASLGRHMGDLFLWGVLGLAIAILKPVFAVAMKQTHDRGSEPAAWSGAFLLLAIALVYSLIATAALMSGSIGLFGDPRAPLARAMSSFVAVFLAAGLEMFATFAPAVILTSLKSMRESYERPAVPEAVQAPAVLLEPVAGSFEQGFSQWAPRAIAVDAQGRLPSPRAYEHFVAWAMYNGPYQIPSKETFGKALADHCKALGALPGTTNGRSTYAGVKLSEYAALPAPSLPAIAR